MFGKKKIEMRLVDDASIVEKSHNADPLELAQVVQDSSGEIAKGVALVIGVFFTAKTISEVIITITDNLTK